MNTEMPKPAGTVRTSPRWMRTVLVVSLALNLGVAGVVGGAALRWGGGSDGRSAPFSTAAPGDLSFRTAISALPDADRQALRRQMRDTRPGRSAAPVSTSDAATDAVIAALRAPDFNPQVVTQALTAPVLRAQRFAAQGHDLLVARIAAMTFADRQAYADRLAAELANRPDRRRTGR